MWLAVQCAPFVCGDTGSLRDLDYVMWEVRLSVLMALVHCKLRGRDAWTVAPEVETPVDEAVERGLQRIRDYDSHIQT